MNTYADLLQKIQAPPAPPGARSINNGDEPMPRGVYERKPKAEAGATPVARKKRARKTNGAARVDAMAATDALRARAMKRFFNEGGVR